MASTTVNLTWFTDYCGTSQDSDNQWWGHYWVAIDWLFYDVGPFNTLEEAEQAALGEYEHYVGI